MKTQNGKTNEMWFSEKTKEKNRMSINGVQKNCLKWKNRINGNCQWENGDNNKRRLIITLISGNVIKQFFWPKFMHFFHERRHTD